MAKQQIVSYGYVCDVCGDPIPGRDGDEATRTLSWGGADFVVDVCETHGSQLAELLRRLSGFVGAGRRSGGKRGRRAAASSRAPRQSVVTEARASAPKRADLGAIRSWARANGHKVGERGRIPAAVIQDYDAAKSGAAAVTRPAESTAAEAATSDGPAAKRRPRSAVASTKGTTAGKAARNRSPRGGDAATNGSAAAATPAKSTARKAVAKASAS